MLSLTVQSKFVKTIVCLALVAVGNTIAMAGTKVDIYPGTDIPTVVAANVSGTTFVIHPGLYRLVDAIPAKDGDIFIGQTSCAPPTTSCPAILNGSKLLTSFQHLGSYYYAAGQTQQGQLTIPATKCEPNGMPGYSVAYPGCVYPEDLYFDDKPLVHVTSLTLVAPGTWYFDYPTNTIYFHDNPSGHKIEASLTPSAFDWGPANNVVISGLTVEKFSTPIQYGAIGGMPDGNGSPTKGANWVLKNNEIRLNHGQGVTANFGWQVLNNYIHHNGNLAIGAGIGGGNPDGSGTRPSGVLIQGNELAYNNYAHVSPRFGAGGSKFTSTYDLVFRDNYSHDNEGSGFHTDIGNVGAIYDNNVIADNTEQGIFHEISYAVTVRNNKLLRNGYIHPNMTFWLYGTDLLSSTSQDMEAYCNTVEISAKGGNGLGIIGQVRTPGLGSGISKNNYFHHNTVIYDGNSGLSGAARGSGVPNDFFLTNRFDFNTYHLPSLSRKAFGWNDKNYTFTQLQAAGQDVHGSADQNYTTSIPVVKITSPVDGATVSGTVNVAATAKDKTSIDKVEFYVDWVLKDTDTSSPFTYSLNTSGLAAGPHTLVAMAYSASGTRMCYGVTVKH